MPCPLSPWFLRRKENKITILSGHTKAMFYRAALSDNCSWTFFSGIQSQLLSIYEVCNQISIKEDKGMLSGLRNEKQGSVGQKEDQLKRYAIRGCRLKRRHWNERWQRGEEAASRVFLALASSPGDTLITPGVLCGGSECWCVRLSRWHLHNDGLIIVRNPSHLLTLPFPLILRRSSYSHIHSVQKMWSTKVNSM